MLPSLVGNHAKADDWQMNSDHSPIMTVSRIAAVTLVFFGCAAAITTHLGALNGSNLNPVTSPIGELAWSKDAVWFRYGLWLFALGHLALVLLLNRPGASRLTRGAQFFLLLDAALIFWLPWHFASVPPTELVAAASGGPLWLLGGSVGFAMTCVAGALWRSHRSTAFLTLVCLLLWSILAPVFITVDPGWIGAYQRTVGVVLLFWTVALAVRLGFSAGTRTSG